VTTQDKLILAQTIILFLTGAVVVWYTVETAKIRRASSKQAEILGEQLQMLRAQVEREAARDAHKQQQLEQDAQPLFHYEGGVQDSSRSIFRLVNNGSAAIRDVSIGNCLYECSVSPSALVRPGDAMQVLLVSLPRPTPPFTFTLEFTDKFGRRRRRLFEHTGTDSAVFRDREAPSNDALQQTERHA
jgi:hypothetical protein